jgi:hypothetical protein
LIFDGVELPRLVPIAKAAEVMALSEAEVRRLIANRELQSVSLNGTVHVLTDSIADRLGEETPSRHNRDCE